LGCWPGKGRGQAHYKERGKGLEIGRQEKGWKKVTPPPKKVGGTRQGKREKTLSLGGGGGGLVKG